MLTCDAHDGGEEDEENVGLPRPLVFFNIKAGASDCLTQSDTM